MPAKKASQRQIFSSRGVVSLPLTSKSTAYNQERLAKRRLAAPTVGWKNEREARLQRACIQVAKRVKSGWPVRSACKEVAARFKRSAYKSNGRKVRLSAQRLRKLYYAWLREGTAAFKVHYNPKRLSVPKLTVHKFAALCQGTDSAESAMRILEARWRQGERVPGIRPARSRKDKFPLRRFLLRNFATLKINRRSRLTRELSAISNAIEARVRELEEKKELSW